MKIRDWAIDDRPREKMLHKGISSLSDAELLAILIGSGNQNETAVQLSQRILQLANNNLNELGKLSVKDLVSSFKGIGEVKAITIAAALELGKRRGSCEPIRRMDIRSSNDAYHFFYPLLCDLPYEELWVVLLNRSNKIIDKIKISQGGIGETVADLRLILKAAIHSLATGIILCHNHPSGNIRPSQLDDKLTDRLQKAARLLDINLADHIIIADDKYYSYADEGRLNS
ncbi:RadC family protein [Parabacteroides bouchesdurhonensis]|uniref:RadC family protein n=1 Tax=Parabacteroides bouchesdurhonensis TaxID=1936995 RepID=UPI000E494390|nr:DNA repair protein RadC [Parabacteroides bouchesdurhonensis]RHJ90826.1 DNA repair protein RadC [Bacteroides sp. AM07-16]